MLTTGLAGSKVAASGRSLLSDFWSSADAGNKLHLPHRGQGNPGALGRSKVSLQDSGKPCMSFHRWRWILLNLNQGNADGGAAPEMLQNIWKQEW